MGAIKGPVRPFPSASKYLRKVASGGLLRQLLMIDVLRYAVARARYEWFRRRRGIRTHEGGHGISENAISHNLRGLYASAARRSAILVRPLSVLEVLGPDSRILSIGPRTEGELLNLVGHGFRKANIRGLDLISYTPWIDLGDMHSMPYGDDSFDAVVAGWVFAYSTDRPQAAKEVLRVTKEGGVVAIGVEHHPASNEEIIREAGYLPGAEDRIRSVEEILSWFRPHVDKIYLSHDIVANRPEEPSSMLAIFSISKRGIQ